jgi:hypothetical protein
MKILLVDACRNDPTASRGGIDADNAPRPPQGVVALFSCKAGERAYEDDNLKHGVFFHFVLEGLQGKACFPGDTEVTFNGLTNYVTSKVVRFVPENIGNGSKQTPALKADFAGNIVLSTIPASKLASKATPNPLMASSSPSSSKTKIQDPLKKSMDIPKRTSRAESPIDRSIPKTTPPKIVQIPSGSVGGEEWHLGDFDFCWCPDGDFRMGSPKSEKGRQPNENQVNVELVGFWMGKFEITQKQWVTVMGTKPWSKNTAIKSGDSYPASCLSHSDALTFCKT